MAEVIETEYTESEIADLRASGHWPSTDELITEKEAAEIPAETDAEPATGEAPDVDPEDIA